MDKIVVAQTAGFCMGVKRAVDMVLGLVENADTTVYTYGPLIHNPQVTELLAKKGVVVVGNNKELKSGIVVIRTHGIKPEIRKEIEQAGAKIYDATCPFVIKVQRIIEEYSKKDYTILIVGDKGHAEVDSYIGYARSKGIVISSADEVSKLDIKGKVCIVGQTTQDKRRFNDIINKLKSRGVELQVFDTICSATSKRQEEALHISKEVDAVVVIGGRNSANTLRLAELCRSTGTPTYFVEQAGELKIKELEKYKTIGITAGASTSKETIREVVDKINGARKS